MDIIAKELKMYEFDEQTTKYLETKGIRKAGIDEDGNTIYEDKSGDIRIICGEGGHFCHYSLDINDMSDLEYLRKAYNYLGEILSVLEDEEDVKKLPLPNNAKVVAVESPKELENLLNKLFADIVKEKEGEKPTIKKNTKNNKKSED